MSLSAGSRIGAYEITGPLGAGGMGEVYRGRDTKLNREVAIKVLPDSLARDPERRLRFEREAKALAALNHPNIAQIYAVEENAFIMELVDGETLAARMKRGPVPPDEALKLAGQMAAGLEAAHEKGIIHRDFKPGNVMVSPSGKIKILDFGLVGRTASPDASSNPDDSPTLTIGATQAGAIMGTAAYMAPEQARGKAVDKRADIFAFGVVLWEMLTGERLFRGEDLTETLASVVKDQADLTKIPTELRKLVGKCLEKDPARRLRDIGDAMELVEERGTERQTRKVSPRLGWIAAILATIFGLSTAAVSYIHFRETMPEGRVFTTSINQPPNSAFNFFEAVDLPQISPDGRSIVFGASTGAKRQLWLRLLNVGAAQPLAGTEGAVFPFWSPDSRSIGFFADGKLKRIDLTGGLPVPLVLADAPSGRGGAWSRKGVIVFAPTTVGGLFKVAAGGGVAAPITQVSGERGHRFPSFLPDGVHFLYGVQPSLSSNDGAIRIGALDVAPNKQSTAGLLAANSNATYRLGHLLFIREGTLLAQPFNEKQMAIVGEAAPIAEHVGSVLTGGAVGLFSASDDGSLLYQRSGGEARQLTWFDRSGKPTGTFATPSSFPDVQLSPDSKRLAVSQLGSNVDLWIYDIARALPTRFTFGPAVEQSGVWSPDGASLVFTSAAKGWPDLYRKSSDGSGSEELLYADEMQKYPTAWSPDGKSLLIVRSGPKNGRDLWILPLIGDRTPYPLLTTPTDEFRAQFSPDGGWVTYSSDESGRINIFVMSFPGKGGKRQISHDGGTFPRWSPDGKEIFYIAPDGMLTATAVTAGESNIDVGTTRRLNIHLPTSAAGWQYDIARDGRVIAAVSSEKSDEPLTLVQNWTALLRK